MATEQSERIRAALMRVKASRQSSNAPALETAEEPELITTVTDVDESSESAESETESMSAEESLVDTTEEAEAESETATPEPLDNVETVLPLLSPSQAARTVLPPAKSAAEDRPAPAAKEDALKEDLPWSRPRIDAGGIDRPNRFPRNAAIVGGVIAVAGLSVFLLRGRLWPDSKPSGSATSFPLQMQVESQGNGIINIRWNPQSAAVIQSREGRLVITERDQQTRTIALTTEQLKIGHLFYQSPVERVEFRLEIVDRSGGVAKESVLALSSGASTEPSAGPPVAPSPDQPSTQSAKNQKAAAPVETQPDSSRAAAKTTEVVKTPPAPQPSRQPMRSFAPPPSQRKNEDARTVLLDDAPPVVPGGSVALPAVSLPEAAVHIPAPLGKEPAAKPQLKTGGNIQAPKLVKRVTPVYPTAAQAANIQGKVRFTATIGKDGSISNLQAVAGPPVLIPAATEAVKKWVYEPMTLNGEPTEVVTQIEVNFALHQ